MLDVPAWIDSTLPCGSVRTARRSGRALASHFQHERPFLVPNRRDRQARLTDEFHLGEPRLSLDLGKRYGLGQRTNRLNRNLDPTPVLAVRLGHAGDLHDADHSALV